MRVKKSVVKKTIRRAQKDHAKIVAAQKKSGGQTLFTPERAEVFCQELARTAQVSAASEILQITRQTAYAWREKYPEFEKGWDAALKVGMTRLEDEGVRRAVDGVLEPVYYRGKVVGKITKYSDTLLTFMLAAHNPKYGKTRVEGPDGTPLIPPEIRVRFVEVKK